MSPDWLWLFSNVCHIDVEFQDIVKESFLICRQSSGGITMKDICDMSMKDYLFTVNYADALQKRKDTDQSE